MTGLEKKFPDALELVLKYGDEAIRRATDDVRHLPSCAARLDILMRHFGRDFHRMDPIITYVLMEEDPLSPTERISLEMVRATERAAEAFRAFARACARCDPRVELFERWRSWRRGRSGR